jgi:hypothetical protein
MELVGQRSDRPEAPAWLQAHGALVSTEPSTRSAPAIEPLFRSETRLALLAALLATDADEGDLDLELILERLSQLRPIEELPRLPVPTLQRGVQVLLDVGQGMDPYAEDRDSFAGWLGGILPNDRVSVLQFVGCPSRGCGIGPRSEWSPWVPPNRGTPVLALTDLGINGPIFDTERGQMREWLAFARRLEALGCPFAALLPYAANRWPPRLARAMRLLHWSERANTRQVTYARRRRR